MINLIVIVISAIMFALLLVWWRWPAFRVWIEAPKYSMLLQERRFDDRNAARSAASSIRFMALPPSENQFY
jgi:hypothetical protein